MRTFNHVLSSQRISIERAFGQLVRRWGILWCANSSRLASVSVIVLVCAKLHNICVDRWMINDSVGSMAGAGDVEDIPLHDGIDNCRPTDAEVANRLHNKYSETSSTANFSDLRNVMAQNIWDMGLRITSESDLIGLPSIL